MKRFASAARFKLIWLSIQPGVEPMRRKHLIALVAAGFAFPSLAGAHHGWSSYDAGKTVTVVGTLSNVEWRQPHVSADVSHQGNVWKVVLAPPRRMETRGLTPEMLAPDKAVTLEGYPRSDGSKEMRIERLTANDKTVELR